MTNIIQSAGGIVYHLTDEGPRYLIIKRHARSGKIEWVAPKGKIQSGETSEVAALREISEETGIPINQMIIKQKIGQTHLRNPSGRRGMINKDVTYFLVQFKGSPDVVQIADAEGYLGYYKRASLREIVELLYYKDMRELVRQAHMIVTKQDKHVKIKDSFMKSL